jgi:CheY-like chemotaxis protein/anti-sigma regulatory factor (Ser/Thr protein kinase)
LRIIDDILDFSKIEAGKLDLECIELSTIELVEGAAETLAPQAAAKGIKLQAYVAADVPERVIGDPLRLQQILFNLLGNALKFTERGSVCVAIENAGEGAFRIRVADTGIGLTEEQRERLFQPFVQADNTTTRRFGGTGLGLSIVRRLAEAMQGDVTLESMPDIGSTFTVTVRLETAPPQPAPNVLRGLSLVVALPDDAEARAVARYLGDAGAATSIAVNAAFTGIQIGLDRYIPMFDGPSADLSGGVPRPWRRDVLIRAVARAAGRPAELARPSRAGLSAEPPQKVGGRVLVVDDNSVNRKILARQLELAGASTDAAAGGEEALELWRNGQYDLVLADLQMPSMDGFELARRIRENERLDRRGRTPILAVTASALEDQEHKSRAVGMDGLITKPVGIEQLKATLDVWLKDARTEHTT